MSPATLVKPSRRGETLTRKASDGSVWALSSDGVTEYAITLAPAFCACPGFAFRGCCRHLAAAQQRYSEPQPDAQPCHACGYMTTGIDSRRVSAGRYVDIPLCRLGEGHCA